MTVAVFTDVHGNAAALKSVLADIDRRREVDRIYSLGDMVAIGPNTNEVLSILFARPDISLLAGNHEDAVLAAAAGRDPGTPGTERDHHIWIAERLDRKFLPRLRELPRKLWLTLANKRLLMVHYHSSSCGTLLPVDREPTAAKLDALYHGSEAAAVFFGHHHPVHHFETESRLYVNPGSLGCGPTPEAPYALVDVDEDRLRITLLRVPYDNAAFLSSYRELKVPAGDFILRTFHGGQGA